MDTNNEAVSNGLALVSIPVRDQEKSKRFYHEVLGFPSRGKPISGPGRGGSS
ncbi:MAG: VOC family protein [Bryobacteraceae bacterium]|jgi:catechol-2,3-dioxygenase